MFFPHVLNNICYRSLQQRTSCPNLLSLKVWSYRFQPLKRELYFQLQTINCFIEVFKGSYPFSLFLLFCSITFSFFQQGLIQVQILPRLRYIFEVCKPSEKTVNNCMAILTRIVLHSTQSAYEVMKCPRLILTICSNFLPLTWIEDKVKDSSVPFTSAARLVRMLCLSGKSIASKLVSPSLIFKFLIIDFSWLWRFTRLATVPSFDFACFVGQL